MDQICASKALANLALRLPKAAVRGASSLHQCCSLKLKAFASYPELLQALLYRDQEFQLRFGSSKVAGS